MGATRIIILVLAAVCAVGVAMIVGRIAGHKPPPPVAVAATPSQPMAQVLVARRDLPVGTRLAMGDLAWQAWPVASLNPVFITDGRPATPSPTPALLNAENTAARAADSVVGGSMEQRYGAIVREGILANEPVTDAKLVRGGEGGYMAVVLHPGMRAVATAISASTAAGGYILPGDRVDVLQSHAVDAASNGGHAGFSTQTLLRNVRVLAIDQTAQPGKNAQTLIGGVATLEVAAADAEVMAHAKAQGDVILALRAYSDAGGPAGRGDGGDQGVVRIVRNGQASEVMVTP